MTKSISLTRGFFTQVSDDWFDYLNQWKWYEHRNYVVRNIRLENGKQKTVFMHNVISPPPVGMVVDHKDRNGLNNQIENLRICTHSENNRNQRMRKDNTSGYIGIYKDRKKWRSVIEVDGVPVDLKSWDTKEDAARAYDEAARKYHGDFAKTNF